MDDRQRAGTRSIDHYVLGKTLGIGSFGKVQCEFPGSCCSEERAAPMGY